MLAPAADRSPGTHRVYDQADVERLQELLRLRRVLGLSLEELSGLSAEESARAARLKERHDGVEDPARRREILEEANRSHCKGLASSAVVDDEIELKR